MSAGLDERGARQVRSPYQDTRYAATVEPISAFALSLELKSRFGAVGGAKALID